MPCLLGCLALAFPRLVIILVWLLGGNYFLGAFQTLLWPLLGFIFLPLTTLAYAFAINSHGRLDGAYLVIFVLAVLVDLGLLGGGGASSRNRRWRRTAL
ncbi:MAG: hypothetical protein WD042_12420 [Phycisphaeraceae bacterium]